MLLLTAVPPNRIHQPEHVLIFTQAKMIPLSPQLIPQSSWRAIKVVGQSSSPTAQQVPATASWKQAARLDTLPCTAVMICLSLQV